MADEKQFSFDLSGLPDRPEESQGKPIEFDLSRLPDQPESAARPSLRQGKEQPWTTLFSHGYLIGPGNTITGGAPNQKATQALGLAEQFDVTPSFAMDHIQELSEELIHRGRVSLPEVAMVLGPVAFTVLAPYLRVLGWGAFEAVENIARLMNTSKGAIATGAKIASAGEKAAKGLMVGVPTFMAAGAAYQAAGGAVRMAATGEQFRPFSLTQLTPSENEEWTNNTLEALDFIIQGIVAGGAHKGGKAALPLWERFTKQTLKSYGLPREVYISSEKIRDIFQTGEKIGPEELDLVKGLGLTGEQYRDAIKHGLDISIPTEKIISIADKPWYAKLKQAIKITPYEEVLSSTPAGKPKAKTHTERLDAPGATEKTPSKPKEASKDSDGIIKQPVGYVPPDGRTIVEEARLVTAAMGQVESGNRPIVPGQVFPGGWIQGRFQYEPETWKQYSAEYNQALYQKAEPLPNTDTNQQLVTEWKVAQWLEQGYSPKQIAATWNSGSADWVGKVGVNDRNEPYNVPLHVDRFYQTYEKLQGKTPEPMTRDRFQAEIMKAPGITEQQTNDFMGVVDAIANSWAESYGRKPEEWFSEYIADVQVGGKDIGRVVSEPLFQAAKKVIYDDKRSLKVTFEESGIEPSLEDRGQLRKYLESLNSIEIKKLKATSPDDYLNTLKDIVETVFPEGADLQFRTEDGVHDYEHFLKDAARRDYIHSLPETLRNEDVKVEFAGSDARKAYYIKKYFDPDIQRDIWDLVVLHNNEVRTKFARTGRKGSGYIESMINRAGKTAPPSASPARDTEGASTTPETNNKLTQEPLNVKDDTPLYQRIGKKGAVQFLEDGRAIVHLFQQADVSTLIHETAHILRKQLSPEDQAEAEKWVGLEYEGLWEPRDEEKFARAFEAYVMEGKAPSFKLRAIFSRMKKWLLNIYQSVKNLKVELDDNIRGVFDRLVSTEAERKEKPIYEMNEDYYVEPSDHPLTVKEMDSYDKLASEAYRRARVNVEAQMKREDAKREAGWRKEALELLKDDPVHSGMDEIVKRGGLNEKQLRADYGDETIGSLKAARRGLVSPKGKLVPDEVAADFGFGDPDSMVQAFINSKTKPEAIESIVDSLRSEYAPTKEELAADMHLRLLDEEIKVLKEITESATAKMQNKTARGIKQVIRENTGQIKVDQVNDRGSYPELIAAMKREAAAARTAFNAGKKEAALKAKERQREISQKYRDMVKARNEFQKITKSLNRMLNDKKVNWEYKEALIELIQLTGRTKRQAKLKPGALQEFVDKQEVNGEAIIIDRDFIMRLQEMYYRGQRLGSMSMDDVRLLHDTAKQIHYAGKIHDQFIGEQRKISFQASKLRVIRSIYQNAKTVEVSPDRPLPPSSREKGVAQKFLDGIDAYHSELLMPEMILRALDGFHEMGPVYEEMWLECKAAADAEIRLQEKASKAIDETLALIEDRKAFSTEKHTVKGLPFPMTRLEMVGWYLHSLHPDNRAALAKGFGDPEKKEWLTEEQIDIPGNLLTEREKEIARKIVEELLPILTPHVEKTYLALNGRPMIRVKGVYYPLYFDRKLSDRINEAKTEREAEQAFKDFFPFIGTKFGSTIERKGGKYPPELNFIKVLSQYFNEGTHFATHAVAVRNLLKIINDPDFKRAVTIARGENAYKQLKPWLKEIANPGREPMLKGEALVGYIRRNTTAFIMVGRLSTALIQPTAILSAIPEVGAGWVLKGVSAYLSNPWKWDKFIEERSASIANRSHSYDREMADVGNGDSWKDLYLRWGMYMTAYLDARTARMAWLSAYTKAMNGRVENIAQGDEGRAIDYADGVTERSQGSASPKNKAAIMRGGELFKTFITFFYTFFNAQYNQIIQAWGKYKSPTLDYGILDLMKDYWFLLTIPGIINELTRGNTPKTPGDIALYPFTSTGKMLLSTIPLVRDASSVFFEGYDYRGGMLGNVGKEIKSLGNAMDMSKTKRDRLKQILIHGAKATGNLTGLPPDQLFIFLDELTRKRRPTESTKPQNFIWRERKRK